MILRVVGGCEKIKCDSPRTAVPSGEREEINIHKRPIASVCNGESVRIARQPSGSESHLLGFGIRGGWNTVGGSNSI